MDPTGCLETYLEGGSDVQDKRTLWEDGSEPLICIRQSAEQPTSRGPRLSARDGMG